MPMPCAVSVPDDDLRSTERSLLGTLAGVLSAVPDYLFAWLVERDEEAVPLFESRRLAQTLGRQVPLGPLDLLRAAVEPSQAERLEALIHAMSDGSEEIAGHLLVRRDDGARHAVTLVATCTPEPDGGTRVEGVIRDLGPPDARNDELEQNLADAAVLEDQLLSAQAVLADQNRQLAEISTTDYLTGAHNRRHFMDVLQAEIRRRHRVDPPGVLLLDLDRFKAVNDTYGHIAGDAVLITVAKRLRAVIREYDTVARYGGEEFAVLLPEIPDDDTLAARADAIRRAVSVSPIVLPDGAELAITASCGAATWTAGETDEALIDAADRALYAAKRGGRDQTRLASSLTSEELSADEPEAFQLARGLALAVTVREASPERHCEEVADLAGRIAEQLGLSDAVAMCCRLGGWVHDIGKLAIPDRVLQEAAPTEDGRALLRTHVTLGADIVSRVSVLAPAASVVRHHHERYDGGGYPDGLRGDAIPIEARIVAAADAWSAITAGRAYQEALDPPRALELLRSSAGASLDPAVVEALAAVVTTPQAATSAPARSSCCGGASFSSCVIVTAR